MAGSRPSPDSPEPGDPEPSVGERGARSAFTRGCWRPGQIHAGIAVSSGQDRSWKRRCLGAGFGPKVPGTRAPARWELGVLNLALFSGSGRAPLTASAPPGPRDQDPWQRAPRSSVVRPRPPKAGFCSAPPGWGGDTPRRAGAGDWRRFSAARRRAPQNRGDGGLDHHSRVSGAGRPRPQRPGAHGQGRVQGALMSSAATLPHSPAPAPAVSQASLLRLYHRFRALDRNNKGYLR